MADLTVRDVLSDPEFHALPLQEQHKVMSRVDPEWANMRPADRQAVLSQSRDRTMQNANPSTVPGMGVIPHLGVGLGGGQPPALGNNHNAFAEHPTDMPMPLMRLGGKGLPPDFYTGNQVGQDLTQVGAGVAKMGQQPISGQDAQTQTGMIPGLTDIVQGGMSAIGHGFGPFLASAAGAAPARAAQAYIGSQGGKNIGELGTQLFSDDPNAIQLGGALGGAAGGAVGSMYNPGRPMAALRGGARGFAGWDDITQGKNLHKGLVDRTFDGLYNAAKDWKGYSPHQGIITPPGGHFAGEYPMAGPVQPEIEGAPGGHFAGDYPIAGPHVPSIEHPPGGPWPEGYQPVPGGPGPRETAPGGYWGGGYRATKPTVPPIERAPGGYWGGDYQATPGGPKPITNPPGGHTFKLDLSPFDSSSVDFPDVQFPGEQAPSNVGPNGGKMIESAPAHYNTAGTHPVRQVEQYTIDQKIANQLRATGTQPHQVTPQQMNQLRSQFGHTPVRGTPAEINARLAQLQKTMQSTSAQK